MSDKIVRATAANASIRAFAATTKELVEYARSVHGTSPVMTAALGRLLTGGAMMGAMMKSDSDLLSIEIIGDGPAGKITVTSNAKAEVKGYVDHPEVMLPPSPAGKLDVGGAVGRGIVRVIKDLGLKEPYVGGTELISGEIAEDLTYYFANSEQVPSSVGLGVLMNKDNTVAQAGGFIIQLMPFAPDEVIDRLEAKLSSIPSVTAMLQSGMTPEDILQEILGEFELEILDTIPTCFRCNCSRERMRKGIVSLGKKEIRNILADGEPAETRCHFCNTKYTFSVDELKAIEKESF